MTQKLRKGLLISILVFSLSISAQVSAQDNQGTPQLLPHGGGNQDAYRELTAAAISFARSDAINILLIPSPLSSNSNTLSPSEREAILASIESERQKIQDICELTAPNPTGCRVMVAPVLTRTDAFDPIILDVFQADLVEIIILDGDQTIGMEIISGTPLELALVSKYEQGLPIAGIGAGALMLSNSMIAGYRDGFDSSDATRFGAVETWNSVEKNGLIFGSRYAILDDEFYSEGNFPRLINAISLPESPHVGVGIDADTSVYLYDQTRLEEVSSGSLVTILDAETYQAAQAVRYYGKSNLISLRNVLFNTLAPGDYSYNLSRRQHSIRFPYPRLARQFEMLSLPPGAGPLLIAGGLENSLNNNPIINRFIELCGGRGANVLVLAAGYDSLSAAQQAAIDYANALGVTSQTMIVPPSASQPVAISPEYSCVLFSSADAALLNPEMFNSLREVWLGGMPLLADGGAASFLGQLVFGDIPAIYLIESETAPGQPFKTGDGLKLVDFNITTHILSQHKWDEWLTLASYLPSAISVGLPENTAIELTRNKASSLGDASIFILDLRYAALDYNEINAAVIANGFLDVFAPYEKVEPALADQRSEPVIISTPILNTPTVTPSPTERFTPTPSATPTQKPTTTATPTSRVKPTSTPLIIPPPSDPGTRNLMVMFGGVIVLVIVAGILLNRRRIR